MAVSAMARRAALILDAVKQGIFAHPPFMALYPTQTAPAITNSSASIMSANSTLAMTGSPG